MIHYLTIQDVLWINHEITRKVNLFKFAQLEEATFFQYGYGKSEDVVGQAGNFLEGFLKLRPFSEGNRTTAFVSALTFLGINGYEVDLAADDSVEWTLQVARKQRKGVEAVKAVARLSGRPAELKPVVRTQVHQIMETYKDALPQITE